MKTIARFAALPLALLFTPGTLTFAADPFTISNFPLFLAPSVKPNLMVILDNSQSMDATMGGMIISGDNDNTRGNIARRVLRSVLQNNIDTFNWGLATFETTNSKLYNTQAYYLGSNSSMVFTNDCVNGMTTTGSPLRRCVPNPQPASNGFNFITYERSGDDPDINDVFYTPSSSPQQWGRGLSGTTYRLWPNRQVNPGDTTWEDGDFSGGQQDITFVPTDAGFLLQAATHQRAFFVARGWGWAGDFSINNGLNVTGQARILESVKGSFIPGFDSSDHLDDLNDWLAKETASTSSDEIKNSALFTPLAGSLRSVRQYFAGQHAVRKSPITETCQANYVVLATDGNPTAKLDGTQYAPSQWQNTLSSGVWTYGQAQQDVFAEINALKSTTLSGSQLTKPSLAGHTAPIKTFIIGMGDSVTNPSSVAALNEMARLGGANPTAFFGNSEASLASAFESIVGDIQAKTSTASAAAVNAGSWNAGSRVYQAKFNSSDWSGTLVANPVSSAGVVGTTPVWDAATRLNAQNWDSGRSILTYKGSSALGNRGVPFRWPANPASPSATEIDVAQAEAIDRNSAGTTDGFGSQRLRFLRGDATYEPRNCGSPPCAAPQFRNRPSGKLGDIVNSAPVFVGAPAFGYADDFESAAYSSFASTYRARTQVLYVGANDGMLHAFNAATGDEMFAYVPSAVYSNLSALSGSTYTHRYFVDGSPTVGDVFYGGAWHTLLVAGMRAGAKGLYALDVTNPANFSEVTAVSVVRWEFQDPDLGHVYGQPLLVKTNDGKWSVIVSGGYNVGNASGRAFLFVIDAQTGALVRKIDTGSGTALSPNGLSAPAAIDANGDGIVDVVYAGDLNGNLWKFNLGSNTPASWGLGNGGLPLFTTGTNQAITGTPDVTRHPRGGYLVAFGTGRFLASADTTSTDAQAIYAIWDNLSSGTVTSGQLQEQTVLATAARSGIDFRLTSFAVGTPGDTLISTKDNLITSASYYSTKRGWYLPLPTSGERVVTDATFRAGRLILTSMIPDSSTPCVGGGSGWLLEFDAITGNRLGTPTFDTNGDNNLSTGDFLTFTVSTSVTANVSGRRIQGIPTTPAFISSGKYDYRLIPNTDATLESITGGLGAGRDGRAMWREVR
jgi:type IV pilus assembly protein PilY1